MIGDFKILLATLLVLPVEIWIFVAMAALLSLSAWLGTKRHWLCVLQASQELKRLKTTPAQYQLARLRRVDPFVFEEMILTAIHRQGHGITRNKRYTGDGGIDGQCRIKGRDYLIQAKRYSNYINPAHISDFAKICRQRKKRGLFIHTGKTGTKSKHTAAEEKVEIISGARLLRLLLNQTKPPPS